MSRARAVVAAAALLAPLAPLAPAGAAYRTDRADTVLAVPADGTPVTTPFVTSRGARYRLTVSGVYAYDRLGGLADCGYRDTNATLGGFTWTASPALLVNGAPAGCDAAGYRDTHTYTAFVTGTGSRLAFAVSDPTGNADNAGALTVAVETYLDVDAECEWHFQALPGTAVGVLTVVAEAHQTGAAAAGEGVFTQVGCTVHLGGGTSHTFVRAVPGPAAALTETVTVGLFGTAVQTCVQAAVLDVYQEPLLTRSWPCT